MPTSPAENRQQERSSRARRRDRRRGRARGLLLLEAIGRVIERSSDVRETLDEIPRLVAEHLDMEVCSLYSYTAATERLVLLSSSGLRPAAVGRVGMRKGEGLTGLVVEQREPVMAIDALAHPRYKYFPESGEERYHSFLGVPIFEKGEPVGVLVVQTSRRRRFTRDEVRLLKTISVPTGGLLVQLRLLRSLESKEEERRGYQQRMLQALKRLQQYERRQKGARATAPGEMIRLRGQGAAPGFAIGRAHVVEETAPPPRPPGPLSPRRERQRLAAAVGRARREIHRVRDHARRFFPEIDARIFDAHELLLDDPAFIQAIEAQINDGQTAEEAIDAVVRARVAQFEAMEDQYMRERASDLKDVAQRLLRNLLGITMRDRAQASKVVLIGEELSLSDIILTERPQLRGIVTAAGGTTSHAAILARAMEIPTVVGVAELLASVRPGDHLIVDGNAGTVYVNPPPNVVREYERLQREYRAFNRELDTLRDEPAITRDGFRVRLAANIGLLGDMQVAHRHGAEAVGLYRTEIAFLSHRDFLKEEEQVDLYRRIVEEARGMPVTIRTLDLGADKYPSYLDAPPEANPFLGWRSIRISLAMPDIFKAQLRAILRTSAHGPVRILVPMVSTIEEVRRVRDLVAEAGDELQIAGHPFDPQVPIGIMVEVPSVVQLADRFIEEVDFFSIGTNDLVQYLLAVDRNNGRVATLYEALHPAVLRAVATTCRVARAARKPVSICGEMAADPASALVLLGMGLQELSLSPFFIPVIKRLVRSVRLSDAEEIAEAVLEMSTPDEIKGYVFERLRALGLIDLTEMYH